MWSAHVDAAKRVNRGLHRPRRGNDAATHRDARRPGKPWHGGGSAGDYRRHRGPCSLSCTAWAQHRAAWTKRGNAIVLVAAWWFTADLPIFRTRDNSSLNTVDVRDLHGCIDLDSQ